MQPPVRADDADGPADASGCERVLVLNPASGSGDHAGTVRELATERGFDVRETEGEDDAIAFAAEAVRRGTELVAAAGGDGTVNQVVRGIHRADGLEETTLGVVPAGTGNNFAGNVGVGGIEEAFEIIEGGERRALDVGVTSARGDPEEFAFLNSCIAGLTAEASGDTVSESKSRLGVLAYAVETLRAFSEFEPAWLDVEVSGETAWEGRALLVVVGNARRFAARRRSQANVEDGLFEATIVENRPAIDLAEETAVERLLGGEAEHVVSLRAPALRIRVVDGKPTRYSLDGEMMEAEDLALTTRERALKVCVGPEYEPDPDE